MIEEKNLKDIKILLNNKLIIYSKILSCSFDIYCSKITTDDKKHYIVKYYKKKNITFNAIRSEGENLIFFDKLNINLFPKVFCVDDNYLIMEFINNDEIIPNKTKWDFINAITSIHKIKDDKFGFSFDTQIGGLRQKNVRDLDWVKFYRENRLNYIYELINNNCPMDNNINIRIDKLLKNLENYIPKNLIPSLLHGDLWQGNIMFSKNSFVGLIDPGSFYGHNEMELAYLRWFNPAFIDNTFLNKYNEIIKIDSDYFKYEKIYQLYYSMLNVYLWDRSYIEDVRRLLDTLELS